jgi:hypothetical protein
VRRVEEAHNVQPASFLCVQSRRVQLFSQTPPTYVCPEPALVKSTANCIIVAQNG